MRLGVVCYLVLAAQGMPMPRGAWRRTRPGATSQQPAPRSAAEETAATARRDPNQHYTQAEQQCMRVTRARQLCGISADEARGGGKPALGARFGRGFVAGSVSSSTKTTYAPAWKQWRTFCDIMGRSPWLEGESREDRLLDEDLMLKFLGIRAGRMGRAHSTVKGAFSSIRFQHVVEGKGDPLVGRPRYRMALAAVRRVDGHQNRKYPTSMRMLRYLRWRLDINTPAGATLYAAVIVSFFFMLRASEYVAGDGGKYDPLKSLKVMDVMPRSRGRPSRPWAVADETVVFIKGSKTDRYNEGEFRNLMAGTGGEQICPTWAMQNLHRVRPELAGKPDEYLFRHRGGASIRRKDIQDLLQEAAVACGVPKHLVGSHSQRSGGASAMHNAGFSVERIKRFGRWKSDCVHIYLWDGASRTHGQVDDMQADYDLNIDAFFERSEGAVAAVVRGALQGRPPLGG